MLSRKRIPLTWITLLLVLFMVNAVVAKKGKHHHHDDDNDDDDDDDWSWKDHDRDDDKKDDKDDKEEIGPIDYKTPVNEEWLEGIDLESAIGKVRPVGSGICEDAKCDGTDNDRCFESCGNIATEDDIYGCRAEKTWALTFDDGPSNFTNELLDILDDLNVKATFVVMGAHAKLYPDVIRRAFEAGHQIASHTYSHPHLMSLSSEEIVYEIKATEEAIENAIGVKPRYIRPPYGEADSRVKNLLKQMGYKVLMWNVDPTDYNVHMMKDGGRRIVRSFDKAVDGISNQLNANKDLGYISLQHDLYKQSIKQVPRIVKRMKIRGYEFMTAAECVEDDEPHDRDTRAVLVNAQTVEAEEESKKEHSANSVDSPAQENSASSSYSVGFTFILALVGLSGFFT
ncbi:hypothetical protein BDF21DRAFT_436186 [Thamnidium elegans]|nr:hypothetical protein BDF21DRAFT_436186 [Thamnidium elegans]